jgi:hypothetical protein
LPGLETSQGVLYVNSGTWTEHPPCPFVAVKGREIRLEYWPLTDPESRALALAAQEVSAFEPAPN